MQVSDYHKSHDCTYFWRDGGVCHWDRVHGRAPGVADRILTLPGWWLEGCLPFNNPLTHNLFCVVFIFVFCFTMKGLK